MIPPIYVGGAAHGLEIADPHLHETDGDIAVIVADAQDRVTMERYTRRFWFVGPGEPLMTCFSPIWMEEDEFLLAALMVLPARAGRPESKKTY